MRLTGRFFVLLLLIIANVFAQSKDDEESVDVAGRGPHHSVEGSGNAPSDDEDTVEGSGLPPSQVYSKLTSVIQSGRPTVPIKTTTSAPETPKKKDLPPIINLDAMEKEQRDKEREKEQSVSIAPAILRITTNRPDTGLLATNGILWGVLGLILVLIIVVIIIIVVCRRKHKSDYTPGRPEQ